MNEITIVDTKQTQMKEQTLKYFINEYLTLEQIQQLTMDTIFYIREKMKKNEISLEQISILLKILLDNKGVSQESIIDLIKGAKSELLDRGNKKFRLREKMTDAEKKLQEDITKLLKEHMEKNNKDEQ